MPLIMMKILPTKLSICQIARTIQPIGVAEHIDYVDTAEKKTEKLAEAKDKLEAIKNL